MNHYRALMHYELKKLLMPFAYFFVIDGALFGHMVKCFNDSYESFLAFGTIDSFKGIASPKIAYWLMAHFIGVMIVTALSCKDRSKPDVQKLMQTLPVTTQKRYSIKTLCGILTYFIPYLLLTVMLLIFSLQKLPLIREYALVGENANLEQLFESLPHLFFCLIAYLLIITFMFSLCQLFQYFTTQSLISVVILFFFMGLPFYFSKLLIAMTDNRPRLGLLANQISRMCEENAPWHILLPQRQLVKLYGDRLMIDYVYHHMTLKIFLLLLLTVMCFWGGYYLVKKYYLPDQEKLIPSKPIGYLVLLVAVLYLVSVPFYLKYVFSAAGFASTTFGMGLQVMAAVVVVWAIWKKGFKGERYDEK